MASRSRHVVSRDRVLPDRNGEPLFLLITADYGIDKGHTHGDARRFAA
jgi:hypothetical protein